MEITDTEANIDGQVRSGMEPMSTAIAMELASALDQGPTDSLPLAESIDTDALNRLFRNSDTDIELTFSHADRKIFVSAAGVTVEPKR